MQPTTPGAHVRITVEGIVQSAQAGEITLATGTHITCHRSDVLVEVLKPGFQPGDVVWDGRRNLLRVASRDAEPHWIGPDGYRVHDDEHDPSQLRLIAPAERPTDTP
ncbi:hypothetical protein [Streptomyces sp. NRRL S-337]|uniref:hypothetical protein n=1 Tax=Streptomyces sp. NRRL S-337 TaxID=1463900 RepID=UPI0004CB6964|nr:hypothetical protein [Streptomyces sp. NRRL S-337]